ncbi:Uncharacterized protein Rs2_13689 [Raphanus sativus]|nr:Uncharacterized protein Rs2_13689 [Raphanus sativus]
MTNLQEIQSFSNPKSVQAIPLSSIYYRLFETIENRPVPTYTIPPYQQISKLSPQTPLNKRRCMLGLDKMKDQVIDTPVFSSCLTSLSKDLNKSSFKSVKTKGGQKKRSSSNVLKDITNIAHLKTRNASSSSSTFNAFDESIEEEDDIVGTDLFGENTDTETEDSDLDDHMDFEPEVEPNERERITPNSEHTDVVVKPPKAAKQKILVENGNERLSFHLKL